MQSQNLNQFTQTPSLGAPDLAFNFNTKSVMINPNSVATALQVGQAVKLIAGNTPTILVDQAANNEKPFGVIIAQLKKNTFVKGEVVEIAGSGNVIYLESAAAISRGADVENVPTAVGGPQIQTKSAGNKIGTAIDQASGAGQLIRVEISPA